MAFQDMISPQDTALVLIDLKPAMLQGVQSHDRVEIVQRKDAA